jgi:hypothetical protein
MIDRPGIRPVVTDVLGPVTAALALVGVCEGVHNAFKVTHVDEFFRYFDSIEAAEPACAAAIGD